MHGYKEQPDPVGSAPSTWTRLQGRLRSAASWYLVQASPIHTRRRATAFLLTPQRREVARTPFPSHRQAITWARFSGEMKFAMREIMEA